MSRDLRASGNGTAQGARRWKEQRRVELTAMVLRQINEIGAVLAIPKARVPIVKFAHRPSGIRCDLSFKNELAVKNTAFLNNLIQHDGRFWTLSMTLRLVH